MADLAQRTAQMVAFVTARKTESQPSAVIGLGYSNGANILAAVQFAAPALFDASVLMHPLIPFAPPAADFAGRRVLITAGQRDPICPAAPLTQGLNDYFTAQGAQTSLFWHQGGTNCGLRNWPRSRPFSRRCAAERSQPRPVMGPGHSGLTERQVAAHACARCG